jgi:OmpA-OmpF porin, OOP family
VPSAAPMPPPPPPAAAAPAPPPPQPEHNFIVFFDFDKSTLTAAGRKVVDAAAALAQQNVPMHIQVNGYTDTVGTQQYNLALSRRRADTVRSALERDGVGANRIAVMGYGKENLRVATPDGVKEPQNRRAEILIGP